MKSIHEAKLDRDWISRQLQKLMAGTGEEGKGEKEQSQKQERKNDAILLRSVAVYTYDDV